MLAQGTTVPTYEIRDERGRVIGRVVLPRSSEVVGPWRGTVYLARGPWAERVAPEERGGGRVH